MFRYVIVSTGLIIPVKNLKNSKSRLSKNLEISNRIELSKQMLMSVVDVAHASGTINEIVVISPDENVKDIIQHHTVSFIKEFGNFSVNNAVSIGIDYFEKKNYNSALILPIDLICLTVSDVQNIVDMGKKYDIVLTPSKDGNGTNALYLKLPNVFHTSFDNSSLNNHILESFKKRLTMKIYVSYSTIMDVDSFDDLSFIITHSNSSDTSSIDYLYDKLHN